MVARFIPDNIIDLIRDSADIVEVIAHYVNLRKTGRNFVGLCPFHSEKTPSFSVNPEKGIFYCFGCGKGGNVFKFLMEFENLNFVESVRYLADRYHITIPESTEVQKTRSESEEDLEIHYKIHTEALNFFIESLNSAAGEICREYLIKRGISKNIIETFQLGYAPPGWKGFLNRLEEKNYNLSVAEKSGLIIRSKEGEGFYDRFRDRLMFPIHNIAGRVEAFGGRSINDQEPKYLNSPETPIYTKGKTLYGLHRAKQKIRKVAYVMIVEGYMDLIAMVSVGIDQVVATLGTSLTLEQARLLKRFTRQVALIFDTDNAGINATLRGIEIFSSAGLQTKVVHLPGEKDPDDFIREKGLEEFKTVFKNAPDGIDYILNHFMSNPEFKTPHGKGKLVDSIIPYLTVIKDQITRSEYIKQFAEKARIDEQIIVEKIKELTRRKGHFADRDEKSQKTVIDGVEKQLIHCLIIRPDLLSILFEKIDLEEINHPGVRESLEMLAEKSGEVSAQKSAKLVDHFCSFLPDTVISGLSFSLQQSDEENPEFSEENPDDKTEKIFQDCLNRIRKRFLEQQLKSINIAIKEAEKADNHDLVDSLTRNKTKIAGNLLKGNFFS